MYVCMYVYIYIYREREREIKDTYQTFGELLHQSSSGNDARIRLGGAARHDEEVLEVLARGVEGPDVINVSKTYVYTHN